MTPERAAGRDVQLDQYIHCRRSIEHRGSPRSTCLGVKLWSAIWFCLILYLQRPVVRFGRLTLHGTAEGVQNSLRGEILGGNEVDEVPLAFFLLRNHNVSSIFRV